MCRALCVGVGVGVCNVTFFLQRFLCVVAQIEGYAFATDSVGLSLLWRSNNFKCFVDKVTCEVCTLLK